MPRKGQITVPKRFCENCGKELWKYTKKVSNKIGKTICKKCWRELTRKKWICIECGKIVERKRKRCFDCALIFRHTHIIELGKRERTQSDKDLIRQRMLGRDVYWLKGKKRPEHSIWIKNWWDTHPEMKEKARQRGLIFAQDEEWIKKVSSYSEKNPMWKGGIANSRYKGFHQVKKDKIRKRDNYTCQLCCKTETELGYKLSIHHVNFDKNDSQENNLISLCKNCNSAINCEREKWIKHFQDKIVIINGNG